MCDIRSPEEYARSRIPGARGAFGTELALLAADLQGHAGPVVVHCSGRTRSIIACQTLREFGLTRVYALENGTM
ncbi:MAG: rhodanese-like domain-containing protein, partial [Actinobacteria bacterium]|nr:rhodanese-like domain-containing protein [Actinomycetota bacterium]